MFSHCNDSVSDKFTNVHLVVLRMVSGESDRILITVSVLNFFFWT